MGPTDFLIHACGFVAPAAFLALVLPTFARLLVGPGRGPLWWVQAFVVFVAGAAVLGAGLGYFGRDGKMATYAAMAAVAAVVQWLLVRAWKK